MDDVASSGAINIRPEVKTDASNSSDSNASSAADQTLRNEFAAQSLEVRGVEAAASFAPVSLSVSPTIKGSGSVSAALNTPWVLPACAVIAVGVLVLVMRRRRVYGYYRRA